MKKQLTIVIPCLNEASTIEKVVTTVYSSALKHLGKDFEIIVSDNGSTDGTLEKLTKIKFVKIIKVPVRGYGAALHYGILAAKYPFILFADADLSYDFRELDKFLPFMEKNYDFVLGSRIKGNIQKGAMPFINRYIGTPILTFLIKIIYGINTSDCNSGMRLVKQSFYKKLRITNNGMEWASELLIKTGLCKGEFAEIPISFYKDKRKRRPHLRRWEDGWRHLKVIILLKPSLLLMMALILALIGVFFVYISLFTTIALILIAEFFVFSHLVTKRLEAAIQRETNIISSLLDRMPLVLMAVMGTFLGVSALFIISDAHLFTKYILLYQAILFDLWLFFIETIKTHLVNRLPEKI